MLTTLLYAFIAVIFIQFVFYFGVFRKFAFAKTEQNKTTSIGISVIVCAKNEAENIVKYIPLLI